MEQKQGDYPHRPGMVPFLPMVMVVDCIRPYIPPTKNAEKEYLFVQNIPDSATGQTIGDYFSKLAGPVDKVYFFYNKHRVFCGKAIVIFSNQGDTKKAMIQSSKSTYKGQQLTVLRYVDGVLDPSAVPVASLENAQTTHQGNASLGINNTYNVAKCFIEGCTSCYEHQQVVDANRTDEFLWIFGIPLKATTEEVSKHFERFGPVEKVSFRYNDQGEFTGKARLKFYNRSNAKKAYLEAARYPLYDAQLKVKLYVNGVSTSPNKFVWPNPLKTPLYQKSTVSSNTREYLFVKNLSYSMSIEEIKEQFEEAGPVESVQPCLTNGVFNGRTRVYFKQPDDARKAFLMFNGRPIQGRHITYQLYINGEEVDKESLSELASPPPGWLQPVPCVYVPSVQSINQYIQTI